MKKLLLLSLLLAGCWSNALPRDFRVMWYNVENLFDCENDSLKNDDDFTPAGSLHWTPAHFQRKLKNISSVIAAVGNGIPPAIVGFCEVENRYVLEQLTTNSPLTTWNYQYIHYESPDSRGIDVAMLYLPDKFSPLISTPVKIRVPQEPNYKTRDILYVKGLVSKTDTLHLFLNHWSSKRGGELASEKYRIAAAGILKEKIDSLFTMPYKTNIVIMGDFNDEPDNKSIKDVLGVENTADAVKEKRLYSLALKTKDKLVAGTHKYAGAWSFIDQITVSGDLLLENTVRIKANSAFVCVEDFLLSEDTTHLGKKPFRTYQGPVYVGGYSDHLPIFVDFNLK